MKSSTAACVLSHDHMGKRNAYNTECKKPMEDTNMGTWAWIEG